MVAVPRIGGRRTIWAGLLLFIGVCLLIVVRPKLRRNRSTCQHEARGPLSITDLADGAFPVHMSPAELDQCLRRRLVALGRPTRLAFVGHSRVRQVFETLTARLRLQTLSRAQTRHHAPFVDRPLAPAWRHFAVANSTCVGVWPKPASGARSAGRAEDAWCSRAAAGRLADLEFRWRHDLHLFPDAFRRLSEACSRGGRCPDVLVVNQGLHFLTRGGASLRLAQYADAVRSAATLLRQLASRGVRVVWMLEQPANPIFAGDSLNDDMLVLNTLLLELLAGPTARPSGLHVWVSGASAVTRFWTDTCFARMPYVSGVEAVFCARENYHVPNVTLTMLTDQLMQFVCANA